MSLTCGGRGPCCHVGYAHRHCEHCDTVIPITVQPHTHGYWWNQPQYGVSTLYGSLSSWGQNQFQQLANQQSPLQTLDAQFNHVDYLEK